MTCGIVGAGGAGLSAAEVRYRIIDLGVLAEQEPTGTTSRALGINNSGAVVGASDADDGTGGVVVHAFVWLPEPFFGPTLPTMEMIDLTAEAGFGGLGIAHDVNTSGDVVGEQHLTLDPEFGEISRAFWWDLDAVGTPGWAIELGVACLGAPENCEHLDSAAFAVNDAVPAIAIGVTGTGIVCFGVPRAKAGFHMTLDGASMMQALGSLPGGEVGVSDARAVANPDQLTSEVGIGGFSENCGNQGVCEGSRDSVVWIGPAGQAGAPSYVEELSVDPDGFPGEVLGMNGVGLDGELVGRSGAVCTGGFFVDVQHAVYWVDYQASPVDLHAVYLPGDTEVSSVANAIRNRASNGSVEVVGTDTVNNLAIAWRQAAIGQAWEAASLTDEISPLCDWELLNEASDVNDSGWIVGRGDHDPSPADLRERAYLLIPVLCFGDLDTDGTVDGADLGVLLAAWGPCAPTPTGEPSCTYCVLGSTCPADLDCSGDVDGADLGLVLAQFGCGVPSTGGSGQSAIMAGSEAASLSLEDALALAGFASVEALVQWCATADPSEVEALGIWLAGVMGGGAQ
ncbi:MAG: hypothetical protein KDA22_07875 [Phycisphaerales bacterium]|nr:hypothetical protein [Phycisphaerales bacterium]